MKFREKSLIKVILELEEFSRVFYEELEFGELRDGYNIYCKTRDKFNPFRYIFGKYKYRLFKKYKQPKSYIELFELIKSSIKEMENLIMLRKLNNELIKDNIKTVESLFYKQK